MLQAGLGHSTRLRVEQAAAEAVDRALAGLDGRAPAAVLAMVTAAWGTASLAALVAEVARRIDCPVLAGATVDGLLVGRVEISHAPALAVLALAGVEAESVLCELRPGEEQSVGHLVRARLRGEIRREDFLIVLADSIALSPQRLLAGLERALPGLAVVGLGASEPPGADPCVWVGDEIVRGGCAALLLRAETVPRVAVTTGCRLDGPGWPVTRASGSWVLGLAGRPALDVLNEAHPPPEGVSLARDVRVALATADPDLPPLLRNVVGIDEARGAFALPGPLQTGTRLSFARPDPDFARSELRNGVRALGQCAPAFALHLSCRTRGALLFGEPGVEGTILAEALGDVPLLGLMGAYQLAPAGTSPARLHTYAGVTTLFAA